MGYQMTLEKAGAIVYSFEQFGNYQGTWMAFVDYLGEFGIVEGSYGSCSDCDAFDAEFDSYNDYEDLSELESFKAKLTLEKRYCEFGMNYLKDIQTEDMIKTRLKSLTKYGDAEVDDWFDSETKEYLDWALAQFEKYRDKMNE